MHEFPETKEFDRKIKISELDTVSLKFCTSTFCRKLWAYHYEKDHRRALRVIEEEIIPETKKGVAKGNKVFGGAILTKSDYSTVTIGVNQETENPLFHGEISTLNKFYAENKNRYDDLIFVNT